MKHLDAVDGVIGAIPIEERPASGVIGDGIELLILHLRMPDAETWIAHTATRGSNQTGRTADSRLSPHIQWTYAQDPVHVFVQRRGGRLA